MAKIVEYNKDIREYKDKTFWAFSGREVVCLIMGVAFNFLMKNTVFADVELSVDAYGFIAIALMLPFIALGWLKIEGLYIEVWVKSCLPSLLVPGKLYYNTGMRVRKPQIKVKKSKSKNKGFA